MKSKDLLRQSPLYAAMLPQMLSYQVSYLGGLQFKRHVRKKRPSEDSNLYLDLIENTVAQPICRYIVDTINDVVFEPGIKRDLKFATPQGTAINPDNIEWSQLMLLDADLQNRSMNAFMENVGDLTSIYGQCWVFVDMPQESEGNLGRPYVVAINPIAVWDWDYEIYGGRPVLNYCKVLENEDNECYYFKCYHLGTEEYPSYWISHKVKKDAKEDEESEIIGEGTYPEGMGIPGFMAYAKQDPRSIDYGISDIDSASDAMREYYKLECDAYTSIQFAKTLIRADKGVSVPAQAGSIVRATQGQLETIPVDTGDVTKTMEKQKEVLDQIENLTGLGGLRMSRHNVQSGIAIIEERKQLHRVAKAKARLMEVAEEQIFTYAARFMNMRWAGEVLYATDYDAHDTNYRIAVYKEAKALVPDNSMVDDMITKDIIAILAPDESIAQYEQAFIDTVTDPAMKQLMTDDNERVLSRDLQSQIPTYNSDYEGESDGSYELEEYDGSGPGRPVAVQNTGPSYETQQAIAVQLSGQNTGR
jgi:hypothetical protein